MKKIGDKYAIDGKFGVQLQPSGMMSDEPRIVNLVSGESVPDDEPVALFRSRDWFALPMLAFYLLICFLEGSPDSHVNGIIRLIMRFWEFRKKNMGQMKWPGQITTV